MTIHGWNSRALAPNAQIVAGKPAYLLPLLKRDLVFYGEPFQNGSSAGFHDAERYLKHNISYWKRHETRVSNPARSKQFLEAINKGCFDRMSESSGAKWMLSRAKSMCVREMPMLSFAMATLATARDRAHVKCQCRAPR